MQYIFLSHDVDWRRQGPSYEHIIARSDRFEKNIIENAKEKNPYYNIPEIMEIEEKYNLHSTFFYRTKYEDGDVADYQDDMKELIKSGWEIGLHTDPSSINNIEDIKNEKKILENLCGAKIQGNRVHYLGFNEKLLEYLNELGFLYDSTVRHTKDQINQNEMGHQISANLIEYPLTIMDAYLFTHMKIKEEQILDIIENTLNIGREKDKEFNVITINWHDNVIQMKGGRMYNKILEYLASIEDVKIMRGIDLTKHIQEQL